MRKFYKIFFKPIFISLLFLSFRIHAQEVVFVHTDKSDYETGGYIQFKAYLFNNEKHGLYDNSKIIYFQLTGHDKTVFSGLRAYIKNGISTGQIWLSDSIKTGFYCLSAYTNCMRNYPETACFNKKILIVNQGDEKLDSIFDYDQNKNNDRQINSFRNELSNCRIITEKTQFKTSEKVEMKVKLDSLINKKGISHFSISITEKSPFDDSSNTSNISWYMAEMGNKWKSLKYNIEQCKFQTEKKAFILNGKLINKTNQTSIKNAVVILATPDSLSNLQYFKTNNEGAFYFQLDKYYDNRKIYLQLKDSLSNHKNYIFMIDNKSIPNNLSFNPILNLNPEEKSYIEMSQKVSLVNKIYHSQKQTEKSGFISVLNAPEYSFYGKPDETIVPSNYEFLSDFDEMIKNYVWGVRLKKTNNEYKLNMVEFEISQMMEENALFLINSIPVFDYGVLEPLNTISIDKIELIKRHIIYGMLDFYGVLALKTNDKTALGIYSNLGIYSFDNKAMQNDTGIGLKRNEISDDKNSTIPDFRKCLYWNPELLFDENNEYKIEFYTSGLKTKYVVRVQGITSDNIPVFAQTLIEVN